MMRASDPSDGFSSYVCCRRASPRSELAILVSGYWACLALVAVLMPVLFLKIARLAHDRDLRPLVPLAR